MGLLRLAAAGLLILVSSYSHAEFRTIQAGNKAGLIKAFEDANANTSEMMVVLVKGTGIFEFTDDYQDSGFALPPLVGARVAILFEQDDVTIFVEAGPAAGKSKSEEVPQLGAMKVDGGALFLGALFLDQGLYATGLFPSSVDAENVPKIKQGANTAGPLVEGRDSVVILSGVALSDAGVIFDLVRLVMISMVTDYGGLDLDTPSGESPPSNAEVDSIVPELLGIVTIAKSGPGSKAIDPAALQGLETLGTRVSELARTGDYVLANSVVNAPFQGASLSGPGTLHIENSLIRSEGREAIRASGTPAEPLVRIRNSVISHEDSGPAIYIREAHLELDGVTIAAEDALHIERRASVNAYRSILGIPGTSDRLPACEVDEVSDGLTSSGYNISPDASCGLDKSTDRQNTNPRLTAPAEGSLLPGLANNSPAIDRGPSGLVGGNLPCGTTDLPGKARPQDGNGDGKAECDVGALEMASRGSIDRRQSGAYFDSKRNGEGIFVEMLGPDTALVYLFSYRPNGNPFWALGIGRVVGNGIVISRQDFMTTRGGVFGPGFDPDDVEFMPFADVAINFPDCRNAARKGSMSITPNGSMGFGAVLADLERLSFILDCSSREALGPGYSGSYFDPSHDGEGIILQVINATTVVVQWFTYDGQGNQYWIQGIGTLNGDTITVDEAFAYSGPRYGPNYDPGDLVPVSWGGITIEFNGCDAATFTYDSALAGFGQGTQEMQRLTTLLGIDCF